MDPTEELEVDLGAPAAPSRRWTGAVIAAVAVVALGVGALVAVTSGDDEPQRQATGSPPGLPVDLAGTGGATMAADGAAPEAALAGPVTYVAGPDLPALGGSAPAHRLAGTVGDAEVRALATALGVEGEVRHVDERILVGPDGAAVEVVGGSWTFPSGGDKFVGIECDMGTDCAPACEPGPAVDCAPVNEDVPPDAGVDVGAPTPGSDGGPPCTSAPPQAPCEPDAVPMPEATEEPPVPLPEPTEEPPVPVEDPAPDPEAEAEEPPVPVEEPAPDPEAEADARATALAVVAAAGLPTEGAATEVSAWDSVVSVTVEPVVAGRPSGLHAFVTVDADRAVVASSGVLGPVEGAGEHATLDTGAAVDRLNGGVGAPTRTTAVPPEEGGPDLPAPVEVVLTSVEPVLMPLSATDGSGDTYLVPGYRFRADDGVAVDVVALADSAVAEPARPPTPGSDGQSTPGFEGSGTPGSAAAPPETTELPSSVPTTSTRPVGG